MGYNQTSTVNEERGEEATQKTGGKGDGGGRMAGRNAPHRGNSRTYPNDGGGAHGRNAPPPEEFLKDAERCPERRARRRGIS